MGRMPRLTASRLVTCSGSTSQLLPASMKSTADCAGDSTCTHVRGWACCELALCMPLISNQSSIADSALLARQAGCAKQQQGNKET